jgi:transposase
MKGTIFTDSHTPLTKWFYAVYLFSTTRHGVPAKELERQLGVSYPTAFRMAQLIRIHMGKTDGDRPLSGHVEADEAYIGGVRPGPRGRGALGKTIVFGMLERHGDIMTKVVPNTTKETLFAHIEANVEKPSLISTDENSANKGIEKQGYVHRSVNHSAKEYVRGDTHTNGLEGFWAMIKRSIRGTHIHVSRKHLAKYLGEFEYRYNMRHSPELMFARLVLSF